MAEPGCCHEDQGVFHACQAAWVLCHRVSHGQLMPHWRYMIITYCIKLWGQHGCVYEIETMHKGHDGDKEQSIGI